MKDTTLRAWVSGVSVMSLAFILSSHSSTPAKVVGFLLCIFAILFIFAVTGNWRRYIIGEQVDDAEMAARSYGNMGVG